MFPIGPASPKGDSALSNGKEILHREQESYPEHLFLVVGGFLSQQEKQSVYSKPHGQDGINVVVNYFCLLVSL